MVQVERTLPEDLEEQATVMELLESVVSDGFLFFAINEGLRLQWKNTHYSIYLIRGFSNNNRLKTVVICRKVNNRLVEFHLHITITYHFQTEVKHDYENLRKDLKEVQQLQKEMTHSLRYQLRTMSQTFEILKKKIEANPTQYSNALQHHNNQQQSNSKIH